MNKWGYSQECRVILTLKKVLNHINKLKEKTNYLLNRYRKFIWQNSTSISDKKLSKLGIEEHLHKLIKGIYEGHRIKNIILNGIIPNVLPLYKEENKSVYS